MMISVITPVLNGERFIEFCIANVIEQNCPSLEHIIVDGASTDSTVAIVRKYAARHRHIRWVSEKDQGQSDAMNKGVALARGDIIGILNADDYYEPDALRKVVEAFRTLPVPSLLVGNCNMRGDNEALLDVNRPSNLSLADLLVGDEMKNPFPVNPSAYFYHRSLHEHIGSYKVDEQFAMDIDFLLRAVQSAKVTYVNETLGNFRFIEGTKTFSDCKDGRAEARLHQLLRSHRGHLPFAQQLRIMLLGYLYKTRRGMRKVFAKG